MRPADIGNFLFAAQQQAPGNPATPLIMMILMFVIMYFLLIRPQKVRQRKLEEKIAKIKTGDKIISTAGIHGFVTNVKERTLTVKVDNKNNIKIEFEKSAVASIIPKNEATEEEESSEESEQSS